MLFRLARRRALRRKSPSKSVLTFPPLACGLYQAYGVLVTNRKLPGGRLAGAARGSLSELALRAAALPPGDVLTVRGTRCPVARACLDSCRRRLSASAMLSV